MALKKLKTDGSSSDIVVGMMQITPVEKRMII